MIIVYTHRPSHGARTLAQAVEGRRWRERPPKTFRGFRKPPLVVNWGSTQGPLWWDGKILNPPEKVAKAIDKLECLKLLTEAKVPCLLYTPEVDVAARWLQEDGRVIARTLLRSHSGNGIVVVEAGQEIPRAPLYTRYYAKTHEYRVHVFNGRVVDFVQKKASHDQEVNRLVRTHSNGWVFAHEGIQGNAETIEAIKSTAVRAVQALELDFGAVDILAKLKKPLEPEGLRALRSCKVAEINTAPGLENTATIEAYAQAIRGTLFLPNPSV